MKTLIVGGLGFIGSHLVDILLEKGEEIEIADAPSAKAPAGWTPPSSVVIREIDIRDFRAVKGLVADSKAGCVVHLAGVTGIKRCQDHPQDTFEVNVYGTFNVAEAAASVRSKLIFTSSREIYGETSGPATPESAPRRPNNLYGLTKLLGEQIVEWAHQKLGLRHTILRLTNVYGPRGEKYGLPIIVRKALAGESIELMGGSQVMNFLYVVDAANAIAKCINDSRSDNQAFNVGSEEQLTVDQLLARISELVGRPLTIVRAPARPGETQWFKPDIAKIHRELDWSPTTSLNEGISRLIASYRASADSDS